MIFPRVRFALIGAAMTSLALLLLRFWMKPCDDSLIPSPEALALYVSLASAYFGLVVWTSCSACWLPDSLWTAPQDKATEQVARRTWFWISSGVALAFFVANGFDWFSFGGVVSQRSIAKIQSGLNCGDHAIHIPPDISLPAPGVSWISVAGNAAAIVGVLWILYAAYRLVVHAQVCAAAGDENSLARGSRRLRELLFGASGFLVVGTATIYVFFSLAVPADADKHDSRLASFVSLGAGTVFSMILLLVVFTVANVQQDAMFHLADRAKDEYLNSKDRKDYFFDRKKWAEQSGFDDGGPLGVALQTLVALAPLATALIGAAFGVSGK